MLWSLPNSVFIFIFCTRNSKSIKKANPAYFSAIKNEIVHQILYSISSFSGLVKTFSVRDLIFLGWKCGVLVIVAPLASPGCPRFFWHFSDFFRFSVGWRCLGDCSTISVSWETDRVGSVWVGQMQAKSFLPLGYFHLAFFWHGKQDGWLRGVLQHIYQSLSWATNI